ncbi:hypothetical protein [Streptomyces cyaneofuscatus]|uniref:hypothetical protein n=1 Tax=Streptomyces cyaneofuscatus TaxID=66883 RepID=UPI0038213C98
MDVPLILDHLGERGVADGALEEVGGCRGQGGVGVGLLIGQAGTRTLLLSGGLMGDASSWSG